MLGQHLALLSQTFFGTPKQAGWGEQPQEEALQADHHP
jgi:hypothetical protein